MSEKPMDGRGQPRRPLGAKPVNWLFALIRVWNGLPLSQTRWRLLPGMLARHVPARARVLDVGCGSGAIAQRLRETAALHSIVGVDTVIQPDAAIPVTPYDGDRLPFDDGAFDLVLLIDVLHHTTDPRSLLDEALRVSKDRVLVKDHYWTTRADRWVLGVSDYLGNAPYGIDLPYTYQSMTQWTGLFRALGVSVEVQHCFTYSRLDRCKQVIFVLRKPSGSAPPVERAPT